MKLADLLKKYTNEDHDRNTNHQDSNQGKSPESIECDQVSMEKWPPDLREAFEERAAIMEFEGGLTREEAERQAEQVVTNEFERMQAQTAKDE